MSSADNPLDVEAQLFIDDVSEALQFATDILQQLPASDPRRERLSKQLNDQVSELIAQHANDANQLFDPEAADDASLQQAAQILRGESTAIEQMRVLRGYYGGVVWSQTISLLQCLLEEQQSYELTELLNYGEQKAYFQAYQKLMDECKETHRQNLS